MKTKILRAKFFFLNGFKYIALYGVPSKSDDGWIVNLPVTEVLRSCSVDHPLEVLVDIQDIKHTSSFCDSFLKSFDVEDVSHKLSNKQSGDSCAPSPPKAGRLAPKWLAEYCKEIASSTGFSETDVRMILTIFLQGIIIQIKSKRPFYSCLLLGEPRIYDSSSDEHQALSLKHDDNSPQLQHAMLFTENPDKERLKP